MDNTLSKTRTPTHWVEAYDDNGRLVGYVTGQAAGAPEREPEPAGAVSAKSADDKLLDAIFCAPNKGLDEARAWSERIAAKAAAEEARRAAARAAALAEMAAEVESRRALVALVNGALDELRAEGLDVFGLRGVVYNSRRNRIEAAGRHEASAACLECVRRCKAENCTDPARAADILAEILGLLEG